MKEIIPLSEPSNTVNFFLTELELMKERFSKLLLGEDMSGSGKGVCTAVSISNAITNLYGNLLIVIITLFIFPSFSFLLTTISLAMQLLYLVSTRD